jgi:hypothetical protein
LEELITLSPHEGKAMSYGGFADSQQLSMLAKVLSDYCAKAGIPEGHAARDQFGRRLMDLFKSGIDQPDQLNSQMNTGYDEWLGEIDAPDHFTPPKLSTIDRLADDNILPGSELRGRPAVENRVRIS